MSRYIRRVIEDIQQDVTLSGNSVVISDTHMIDGHEVAPFVPGTVNGISGSDITGEVSIGYDDINQYPINDDPNYGSPGEPPYSYDVAAPAHESVMIATIKTYHREAIRDYSQSNLEYLESTGADVYALFDDGTERKVTWEEVFNPKKPTQTTTINIAQIAEAANQHFWTDDNGAHVTSDLRRSWEDEYEEPGHGTLSTPTLQNPWHNILLNSFGILLRKGLINLASMESGSIAFYDGQGNNSSNINAVFGSQGAQIGKDTDKHIVIDSTGVNAYNGDGTLAPVYASNIQADHADIETLKSSKADIAMLTAGYARIQDLTAAQGKIDNLTTFILQSVYADIDNLTADEIAATDISALNASLSNLEAGSATIQDLETINAFVEMLAASRITTNYLMANYADIDLANVDTEWLNHGVIREASISDAMIQGISANKLTAGEIDASKIIVSNLLANNIIVNSINNVPVTGATVADALRYHDEDINNLNDRLNYELQLINDRIDSQIETFTLQDVPTLNNYPYNEWLVYLTDSNDEEVLDSDDSPIQTEDLRASHIGDIAYVSNPSNEADGYSYRFAYDNTTQTYNWVLIKDNQITAVLQRLIDAEGKIDSLETFESTTSTWKTETDQGITTIRNNITTLTGDLESANQIISTKVDTSTFQTIVDEVDEQSSTITTLTTAVDTLSDNVESSVSTVTSLVNSVKQTADNNSAVIKGLETTTSDLYGISDTINERVSSLNQSLNGFNTTVSNIYSDITDTNKALNQLRATYVISHTANNVSAKTADSIVSYLIDSNGEYILDSNNDRIELYDSLGSFILKQGNRISCTFENGNTSKNPTLNINNTGARPILSYNGEALSDEEINWKPNATFEFVYDGNGWKLQDSGSIKRLSTAETQIDQNARAIELRATSTEVSEAIANIQVGGRNLAMVKDQTLTPTDYSALTMYISSPLVADETYLLQLWDVDIAHSGKQDNAINLAIYYCGGSVQLVRFTSEYFDSGHADYMLAQFIPTAAMVSNADVNNAGDTKFIRFYNSVPNASGTKALTIARVKLEKGTKPTDWTPAPEDMQTIEKATADFKVTSEAISARVEKTDYTGNTLVSMINQTADEVKIKAKHVEIDGMAIFSNRDFNDTLDNKLGSISSYAESIGTDLANYIASNESTLNSLNSLLQNQKDNQVDIWYYTVAPTLSGPPYNGWLYLTDSNGQNVLDSTNNPISVEDTRQNHIGDLYFNTSTGYTYRFVNNNGSYEWVRIKDSDISSSLSAAQAAQATADNKRRIFTTTPTVPYDIGDLWVNGKLVKYAINRKTSSQTYSANDWSTTATDDTMAKENIKSSIRLWHIGFSLAIPEKPTEPVTATNLMVDGWSESPISLNGLSPDEIVYYFYCYQYLKGDGTYYWSDPVYDSAMTENYHLSRNIEIELSDYITKNDLALDKLGIDLKNQIDSQVDIWYYNTVPTLANAPCNGWLYLTDSNNQNVLDSSGNPISVEDTRNNHVGDLYFDTSTGYSYRFTGSNGSYSWTRIQDKDIGAALSAANTAQTTADNKRRIFTTTPTVPYDIGDLWVNGTEVKYSMVKRTSSQTYTSSDWKVTATDDTLAKQAAPKTSAIKRQQRIYYRTKSSTRPSTPSAWVTKTADSFSANSTTITNWTTKFSPQFQGETKYAYMWTCLQSETVSGAISYSDVLIDDTETVIDGGNIVTATIKANKLDVDDINAAKSLTVGAFTDSTKEDISNSTYITKIDDNGIKVHAKNNTSSNYATIDAYGMKVFKGGSQAASFGDTILLGNRSSHLIEMDSGAIRFYNGWDTRAYITSNMAAFYGDNSKMWIGSTGFTVTKNDEQVASFGDTILLGDTSTQAAQINSSGMQIYKGGSQVASFGDSVVLGSMSSQGARINSSGMQIYKGGTKVADFGSDVVLGKSGSAYTYLSSDSYRISWNKNGSVRFAYGEFSDFVIREEFVAIPETESSGTLVIELAYKATYIRDIKVNGYLAETNYEGILDTIFYRSNSATSDTSGNIYYLTTIPGGYSFSYDRTRVTINLNNVERYNTRTYDTERFIVEVEYPIKNDNLNMPHLNIGEYNENTPLCSLILGSANKITKYMYYSTIIGSGNKLLDNTDYYPSNLLNITGTGNIIEEGQTNIQINGSSNLVKYFSKDIRIFGNSNSIGNNTHYISIMGDHNIVQNSATYISIVGYNNYAHNANLMGNHLNDPDSSNSMVGSLICGTCNKPVSSTAFCVGNGSNNAPSYRKNAFIVLSNGSAYVQGTSSSNGSQVTSDKRIKTLISDILPEEGNTFISTLKPRKYYKKTGTRQEKQVGFYAQDIEDNEDFGEYLVSIDNSGNYDLEDFRLLNYQGIIAPLVASVQYLQQENEQLKQKNQELEDRLTRLEELLLNR